MTRAIEVSSKSLALEATANRARAYVEQAKAPSTLRAYRSDWRHFSTWCADRGLAPLPTAPEAVALYLSDLAAWAKPSTLQRRLSAITEAHRSAGYESPTSGAVVRAVWQGIRRTEGVAQHGVAPLLVTELRAVLDALPEDAKGFRDRALLLVGFAGALRRSELVALDVEDLQRTDDGLVITLRRSKTDQVGEGRKVGIPYGRRKTTCAARSVEAWLEAAGHTSGPLFRPVDRHSRIGDRRLSDRAVALIVKGAVERVGMDPGDYAGHSLRAGLATSTAASGASERSIMAQTGHRSVTTVRRYIRDGSLFRDNAAALLDL